MRLICRKLHSGRGASILMALVFFLVCGFVGAVILGSATANAQKVQDRREDQQAYYAVSSAARLLRDTLQDSACKGWEDERTYTCGVYAEHLLERGTHRCAEPDFFGTAEKNLLTEVAWKVFCSQTKLYKAEDEPAPYEFTVKAGENVPDVDGILTMDKNYNTIILLWTESEKRHQMTLTFTASAMQGDTYTAGTCSHPTGEDDEGNEIWSSFRWDQKTITTTITWPTAVISKGDLTREAPHG